tara:strand:+ start:419 stop:1249 length:831 start_codon:yes stop_codon:yes gene_type:complete
MSVLEIIGIIALVYFGISLLIYYFQEFAIFHPEKLGKDFEYQFDADFEEIYIPTTDGATINALLFKKENSKGLVFYFKGNTRSIKGWGKFSRDFLSKDFDFFVFDYRGFGKSKGKRSERNFHKDGHVAYKWLVKHHYKEEDIIIYGRSMGSGFAARIASRHNPKMLILDSPYYSLYHMAKRFLPFFPVMSIFNYHVRTDIFIRSIRCPIFIIHGMKDRLIPYRHSLLLQKLNKRIQLIRIKKAGHNNLPSFTQYHNVMFEILNETYTNEGDFDEIY